MDKEELNNLIEKLNQESEWNHFFELEKGIQTIPNDKIPKSDGSNIKKWKRITKIINEKHFKDKTVLDIGCSDGYFSIMSSKFAKKVIGIDLDFSRIKKAEFIKTYLKLKNCNFFHKSIDAFDNEKFDICLVLGLIHRLPDPLTFLNKLSKITDEIVIEYKSSKSQKKLAFYGGAQKKLNDLNRLYFLFSPSCLENILENLGFKIVNSEKIPIFSKLKFPRHIIHAKKN